MAYIVWYKNYDTAFRSAYFAATGEKIQASPRQDQEGARFLVGSSRITDEQAQTLLAMPEFPGLYIGGAAPGDWVEMAEDPAA